MTEMSTREVDMSDVPESEDDRRGMLLQAVFARLDPVAMACAVGSVGALVLFGATAALILQGAPAGVTVGGHLNLLAHFLPGYSVSWAGSVLALFWGGLIGAAAGVAVAALWNLSHHIFLVVMLLRRGISGGGLD